IASATRAAGPRTAGAWPTASGPDLVSNRLGRGSDCTVFLNFLGVPVLDMSFTGPYGVYHSLYDDHLWVSKFGDPGFRYHAAMTRLWGLLALRLANADIVPFEYVPYARRIREFVAEVAGRAPPRDRDALMLLETAANKFASAASETDRSVGETLRQTPFDDGRAQALTTAL